MRTLYNHPKIAFIIAFISTVAIATPNVDTLTVQGYMKKANGSAVSSGTYNLVYGLCAPDCTSTSNVLWVKKISTAVSGGLFSANLTGAGADLSADSGVTVSTNLKLDKTAWTVNGSNMAAITSGAVVVRVFAYDPIDGNNPSFDISLNSVPTSFFATNSAVSTLANTVTGGSITSTSLASSAQTLPVSWAVPGGQVTGTVNSCTSATSATTATTASSANAVAAGSIISTSLASSAQTLPASWGVPGAQVTGTVSSCTTATSATSATTATTATTANAVAAGSITSTSLASSAQTLPASWSVPIAQVTGAITATNATNATNVGTVSSSANATFFPLMAASSTNGNQVPNLGTGLTFNPSTNTLSTTTFVGALTGNASTATSATTATTATNATNVGTVSSSTNASFFPLMVAASANGNQVPKLGTGLTFNPSTNTLTTTTFVGALTGNASTATTATSCTSATSATSATTATTATNATNIATVSTATNASFFPVFAASSTDGNQAPNLGTGLTFNPSTNTLSTTTFVGALTGNATGLSSAGWASPGSIGSTTPGTGAFSTLSTTGAITAGGTITGPAGAGFTVRSVSGQNMTVVPQGAGQLILGGSGFTTLISDTPVAATTTSIANTPGNSGTSTVNIASGATGTGIAAVSIGSAVNASSLALASNSGNMTINGGAGNITMTSTGTTNINNNTNGAVNIGTGTTTSAVSIGGTGVQTINLQGGITPTGIQTVNIQNTGAAGKLQTVNIGNTTNTTNAVNIAAGSGVTGGAATGIIGLTGHIASGGGAPTVTSGTATCVLTAGNDTAGKVTMSVGAGTCTVTFKVAYNSAPICVLTSNTGTIIMSTAPTTTAFVMTSSAAAMVVYYMCLQ